MEEEKEIQQIRQEEQKEPEEKPKEEPEKKSEPAEKPKREIKINLTGSLSELYGKQYKKLLIIPLIIFIFIIGALAFKFISTGELIERDITLKGGVTITITKSSQIDISEFKLYLSDNSEKGDINVRELAQAGERIGIVIDSSISTDAEISELLKLVEEKIGKLEKQDYSIQIIGSSLGASFFREAIVAVLIAFLFMSVTVLIYFRNFMPSLYVIMAAFADIVMAFGVASLFNIKLSTAGVAAFLMLIGYSIDTDILLTSRVLRGKSGTIFERTLGAMRTGMIMTLTALVTVLIAFSFSQSDVIKQIMLILAIGLFFDIINTWITNAGVLRWYLEKKHTVR